MENDRLESLINLIKKIEVTDENKEQVDEMKDLIEQKRYAEVIKILNELKLERKIKIKNDVYEDKLKRLPNIGAIVKTADGEGEVDNIETLKEIIRVKIKDGDNYTYKKYNVSDIKIIKDNKIDDQEDEEEKEHKKELEELERLEEQDNKNRI